MKSLRDITIREILAILDKSLFTRHAFESTFNSDKDGTVMISFSDHEQYVFRIKESDWGSNWEVTECPGFTFTDEETTKVDSFEDAMERIEGWLQRIVEDLAITGQSPHTDFSSLRESLNQTAESLHEPLTPFSADESSEWKKKLDDLVKKFEKLQEENEIQFAEVNALRKEVASLKEGIETVPKKIWVKSAGNKILNILEKVADSKAGQLLLDKAFKYLLGSDGE